MENHAIFSLKTEVARGYGHGDHCAVKLDTQEFFEVFLSLDEVVVVHLEESVVDGVAQVSPPTIGEGNKVGESLNIFLVVEAAHEGDKGAEKVGDGDDSVTLVGSNDAGFASRVHRSRYAEKMVVTGKKESLNDDGCAGASTNSHDFCHCLDISRKAQKNPRQVAGIGYSSIDVEPIAIKPIVIKNKIPIGNKRANKEFIYSSAKRILR